MKKISQKRTALYMERLGYVPRRPLTTQERIKCGLPVKEKHEEINLRSLRRMRKTNKSNQLQNRKAKPAPIQPGERDSLHVAIRQPTFRDNESYITKDGRFRLKGEDYNELRRQAFERARGRCERRDIYILDRTSPIRCNESAPWEGSIFTRGHLAHLKHGARKSDTLGSVIWSCAACNFAEHGPRWRKQRMAKAMDPGEFLDYYRGNVCLCGNDKERFCCMCNECGDFLSANHPQLAHDFRNATGDPLMIAMGEFRELIRSAE